MTERDRLEREVHRLTQIIAAMPSPWRPGRRPIADRAGLQKQIEIRAALWPGLSKRLSGASTLETTQPGGPRAQAEAHSRSQAHEGWIAIHPIGPARPH